MIRPIRAAAAIALLAGCATARPIARSYPAPSADELIAAVRARQTAVTGVNVEARATSWLGGERVRGTVQMLVERAGRLRFEAEVAVQGTVALLAVNDDHFTFIDNNKHLFRHGPACPANVATLIRIPLAPAEVAAILLGDVPLPPSSRDATVAWDGKRGADVLVLPGPRKATFSLGMRRPSPAANAWDVVFLEGRGPGEREPWRVAYDDFERAGAVALPRLIRFAEAGRDWDDGVEIKIRERVLNPVFPDGAFTLTPPPGYAVETAPCGRR